MEPSNNTETEEETTAFRRKRLRRVSFADNEITSVHIFRRDDDDSSGTPPVSTPDHEILGFFSDLAGDSDNDDKESSSPPDAEAVDGRDSFLRPVGSPSPGGSSTAGSVASTDDDDDFHGPVSASFIRPDRLSDSGISDDNHDHTMDSTAFSMHYRSLARSESGDLKTPTRFGLQFEEKTPSQTSSPLRGPGSLMELTKAKKQTCQSEVSPADVGSGGRDSSDMCIVGEKLQIYDYDYDRLPPILDAILAEGSKDLSAVSPLDSKAGGLLNGYLKVEGSSGSAMRNVGNDDMAVREEALAELGDLNGYSIGSPVIQVTDDSLYSKGDSTVGHVAIHGIQTPVSSIKEVVKGETVPIYKDFTTPRTSSLREGVNKLKRRLSKYSPGTPLFNGKDCEYKQVETFNAPLAEKLFSLTPESNMHQSLINIDDHVIGSSRSISKLSPYQEDVETIMDEENFHLVSADNSFNDKNWKPVETEASPLQMTHLDRVTVYDLTENTAENKKDEIEIVTHDTTLTSLNQKLSPSVECQRNCSDELKQLDKQNESVSIGLANTEKPNNLELSGFVNTEMPSSPSVFSQDNKSAKSATKRKLAQSSAEKVLVLSTPIQEVTTLLPSDGHGPIDNNYHSALQVAESPATKTGVEISSGKKRKGVKISSGKKQKGVKILSGGDDIDKKGGLDRSSPDVNKSGNSEREKVGDQTWNDWADILKSFLGSTDQLLPPSVEKLNLRSIGMLEDILVHLQKVKKMEILCSEIHSQIITDPLNIPRHKRVVEARMLMFNITYEKAKLQLMNIKREKLQKKVEQLRSGLEESQMLKLNFISSSHQSGAMDTQDSDSNIHTSLLNSKEKCQVSCEKVTRMRQELETLDSEAKSLNEFFHSYCKIAGEQSCADTIKSVHDYLQKRMSCKFIFKNLKLWDIEDFERENGCLKVLLNYCSYVFQRFTINAGQPSIIVSNNLNDVNIVKTFPNMDALSAFVFVLNPHTTKEYSSSICLAQETQITSSLLSNLLDVFEEVQSARMEIRNLVDAKFYSHSVQQLDLELSFIEFYSGKKVKVTLDLTCLKCAVYPVEVLPSQIYDPAGAEQKSLPSSFVAEIRTAAESVKVGYSRVTRLCRCISQTVQACGQCR
ncbi:PREDICTED: uncharacterized protein LOC109339029 isoform X2 [Lupinus angustifolius]|uniref:uncharacterized protein LOC109339029 isoform X2 n=1 Tax=Lupinus angustifolius TaxID=3871 RepID=UPI00092F17AD|nr:PREDICTED: uncharacterized protein LOC109339029 isoform X2 [Lupinus angustifolius]